jgi:hypothetical protein
MLQLTPSPWSQPNIYFYYAFYHKGFVYVFAPLNRSDFSLITVNDLAQFYKYKATASGLVFVGSISMNNINQDDLASFSVQNVSYFNGRFYFNTTLGVNNVVYIAEASDLENNNTVVFRTITIPEPSNYNLLTISETGTVYISGCITSGSGTNTVANGYLKMARVLPNGDFSPFIMTNAPFSYSSQDNATGCFPLAVLPVANGYLGYTKTPSHNNQMFAVQMDPQSGKWSRYDAPNWINLGNMVTSLPPYFQRNGPSGYLQYVNFGGSYLPYPCLLTPNGSDITINLYQNLDTNATARRYVTPIANSESAIYITTASDGNASIATQSVGIIPTT